MKSIRVILFVNILFFLFIFAGCSSKDDNPPCENKGTICIENKLDSTLTVNIQQIHYQFQIRKNYIECVELDGNQPYKFSYSAPGYVKDTTFMVIACDNKMFIIQPLK